MQPPPVPQPKVRAAAAKAQAALAQKLPSGLVSVPASTPGGTAFVIGGASPAPPAAYARPPAPKAADFALSLDALSRAAEAHQVAVPPAAAAKEEPSSNKRKKEEKKKEEDADEKEEKESGKEKGGKRKRMFAKELRPMMYGFGDVSNPLHESVDVMEELVLDYIQEMTTKAMQVAQRRGKLQTEDLVFLIRKDRKKHARVKELLIMYDELKRARKAFDMVDEEDAKEAKEGARETKEKEAPEKEAKEPKEKKSKKSKAAAAAAATAAAAAPSSDT